MDLPSSVNVEDLRKIEKEMKKIINENIKIERVEVSREEAAKLFQEMNDRLKLELLEAIPSGESVTLYKQGEFVDLCRGTFTINRLFESISINSRFRCILAR